MKDNRANRRLVEGPVRTTQDNYFYTYNIRSYVIAYNLK